MNALVDIISCGNELLLISDNEFTDIMVCVNEVNNEFADIMMSINEIDNEFADIMVGINEI